MNDNQKLCTVLEVQHYYCASNGRFLEHDSIFAERICLPRGLRTCSTVMCLPLHQKECQIVNDNC